MVCVRVCVHGVCACVRACVRVHGVCACVQTKKYNRTAEKAGIPWDTNEDIWNLTESLGKGSFYVLQTNYDRKYVRGGNSRLDFVWVRVRVRVSAFGFLFVKVFCFVLFCVIIRFVV